MNERVSDKLSPCSRPNTSWLLASPPAALPWGLHPSSGAAASAPLQAVPTRRCQRKAGLLQTGYPQTSDVDWNHGGGFLRFGEGLQGTLAQGLMLPWGVQVPTGPTSDNTPLAVLRRGRSWMALFAPRLSRTPGGEVSWDLPERAQGPPQEHRANGKRTMQDQGIQR